MNTVVSFPTGEEVDLQYNAVEAEQALLGAMLLNNECVNLLVGRIEPKHFYEQLHARIFETITAMVLGGKIANAVTLSPAFRDDSTLKEVGGVAYIGRLMTSAVTVIGLVGYADIVVDAYVRRETNRVIAEIQEGMTYNAKSDAVDILRAQLNALQEIGTGKKITSETIGKAATDVVDRLNEAFIAGKAPDFAFSGSADLNRVLGGWKPGKFYVIAGRPGMGKSTMALSFLLRTAAKGHGVMFFSLEMSKEELTEMALCDLSWNRHSRVEYQDISISKVLDDGFQQKYEQILQVAPLLKSMPFNISEAAGLNLEEIRALALREKQRLETLGLRLRVICVDHLGLVKPTGSYRGNKVAETEEVSNSMKVLAKELDCAVVALAQLNRNVEGKDDKRPTLADLRWSGAIEQDADVVAFVYREAYYLERKKYDELAEESARLEKLRGCANKLELIFAKHRGGKCPNLEFFCDVGCAVVRDIEGYRQ